jgi:hypothetical protein
MWSPVGAERVESLQGRYLIPIVPLLLLSLGISLSRKRITMLFLLPGVIFLHVYAINLLRNRYVRENYSSSYTFDCSFETMTANGFFTTTAPGVLLQANAPPAESEVRTGRGAVQLNSEGDASAMYPLRNLEQYDLMQVDVWMKGKGGQIIITGCGEKCAEFYFVNDLPQFEDERGWKRLNMTYVMPFTCGRGQIVMYLRNGSGTPVIFDDLKLLHKRGKNF